jgi:hypothetical protein
VSRINNNSVLYLALKILVILQVTIIQVKLLALELRSQMVIPGLIGAILRSVGFEAEPEMTRECSL